jgi:hypothetical protein
VGVLDMEADPQESTPVYDALVAELTSRDITG